MNIRFNNRMLSLKLGLLVFALSAIIVLSVMNPILMGKEIEKREKVVIERLYIIRNAELRYRQINGRYCSSIDSLAMAGFIADSIKYIQFSNRSKFKIKAIEKNFKGNTNDFMECSALYDDYLNGLDEDVINETKQQALKRGDFPGLRFGDIEHQSDNIGNWE